MNLSKSNDSFKFTFMLTSFTNFCFGDEAVNRQIIRYERVSIIKQRKKINENNQKNRITIVLKKQIEIKKWATWKYQLVVIYQTYVRLSMLCYFEFVFIEFAAFGQ